MNLKVNLEEDFLDDVSYNSFNPEEISFFDQLPEELQDIVSSIEKKSIGQCPRLDKSNIISPSAFGSIEISKNKVKKVLNLIPEKSRKILIRDYGFLKKKSQLYFLINRLDNYCSDIRKFISYTKKYFPHNFLQIYNCDICQSNTENMINVYVEMGVGHGITFKNFIKRTKNQKEILNIIVQILYIFLTLNTNNIYHNDLKPANIIVGVANTEIKYRYLLNNKTREMITLKINKGDYYPIIIDYDLSSLGESVYVESSDFVSPGSPDTSFLINYIMKMKSVNKDLRKILYDFPLFFKSEEITQKLPLVYKHLKEMTTHSINFK